MSTCTPIVLVLVDVAVNILLHRPYIQVITTNQKPNALNITTQNILVSLRLKPEVFGSVSSSSAARA